MKSETIEVVKNFGTINQNLVFKEGNVLRTITDGRNVLARAVLEDSFPKSFGIYDVNEFIGAYNLIDNGNVSFEDKHINIANQNMSINYFYSDPEMLTNPPEADVNMPEVEVKFILTQEILNQLRKASATLGHKSVTIGGHTNGSVTLSIVDKNSATSNTYAVEVEGEILSDDLPALSINIDNLRLLPGDYQVEVSSKLISKFEHTERDLTYWVALEKK
mgnify:CR=1 FL=1